MRIAVTGILSGNVAIVLIVYTLIAANSVMNVLIVSNATIHYFLSHPRTAMIHISLSIAMDVAIALDVLE